MKQMNINDFPGGKIHMIGIGGSSMSGLAEMLIDRGFTVTGSDRDETYLIHFVREKVGLDDNFFAIINNRSCFKSKV